MLDILKVPVKKTINCTLQSKSIMVVGKSKAGKSTLCSGAPKPIFLMTENGGEALSGFTPIPISTWSEFKAYVNQLCTPAAREMYDTVVIDTYTNLILLLDKYAGGKLTKAKNEIEFGSDADYGKGTKYMRNELGIQLQKLANQGYLLLNIVHAEDKTNFKTGVDYIGTSLSDSLYGVAEKFVDQIIYLRRDKDKNGNFDYKTYFNSKGGFEGAGGRLTIEEDFVPTSFANFEQAMVKAMEKTASNQGATAVSASEPAVKIDQGDVQDRFPEMIAEFKAITGKMVAADKEEAPILIKSIVEAELGPDRKVSQLTAKQAELLSNILINLKNINKETK